MSHSHCQGQLHWNLAMVGEGGGEGCAMRVESCCISVRRMSRTRGRWRQRPCLAEEMAGVKEGREWICRETWTRGWARGERQEVLSTLGQRPLSWLVTNTTTKNFTLFCSPGSHQGLLSEGVRALPTWRTFWEQGYLWSDMHPHQTAGLWFGT